MSDDPLLSRLAESRAEFLAALGRVPLNRIAERPAEGRWSALEVAEHVARVDRSVVRVVNHVSSQPNGATTEEIERARFTDAKSALVLNRKHRIDAPDRVQPRGAIAPEAINAELETARGEMLATYAKTDASLLDGTAFPHPALGPLTLRGWFAMAADHDRRHAEQLDEIAQSLGA